MKKSTVLLSIVLTGILLFVINCGDAKDPVIPNAAPRTPSNPIPSNSAVNQPLTVQLEWDCSDPEGDAILYNIYFGTVADPPEVSTAVSDKTYTPDPLAMDYATLYYWKIVAEDAKGNVTTGPVWSFTSTSNDAPAAPASPQPAHLATGQPLSLQLRWSSSDPEGDPVVHDVWFDTVTPPVTQIATNHADTTLTAPVLTYATDYFWKVTVKDDEGNSTEGPVWRFTTAANQAPSVPSGPSPAHLVMGQELDLTLTWTSTDPEADPVTYDVYFGTTTPPSTRVAADISNASHSLSNLAFEGVYYWKIVARDDHSNSTDGPVWRFTVRAGVWTAMTSGTTTDLYGVWGTSGSNIYAVGASGAIYRYNGTNWVFVRSSGSQVLNGVFGTSASNIYAVGRTGSDTGLILHYNGIGWVAETFTNFEFFDVWAASASDVFAVGKWVFQGDGAVWHYNGTSWEGQGSADMSGHWLRDVWGTDGSNVYAVTQNSIISGKVLHYNGSAWSVDVDGWPASGGLDDGMYGVWGSAANNVFATGEGGLALRYDGSSWSNTGTGLAYVYRDVWGTSDSDVFVTVLGGGIHHYDGSSWTVSGWSTGNGIYGIWGTSYRDVYAVGANGTILHFE
jgi:hypothetical protein